MLALRGLQRLKPGLSLHGNTSLRTITSHVIQQKDDLLVQMENPFKEPEKGCLLCNVTVDFKNTQVFTEERNNSEQEAKNSDADTHLLLSQFISPHTGRIYGRHITGLCGRKQKEISKAIKKAHSVGFMSVTHKHPQFMRDPNVCGIKQLD